MILPVIAQAMGFEGSTAGQQFLRGVTFPIELYHYGRYRLANAKKDKPTRPSNSLWYC